MERIMTSGKFLPTTRAEMAARGWDTCDVIIVTGDAYVDHPSFGAAIIGRWLEHLGCRVGILAQPDLADPGSFHELGAPRLFWGITAGNLDSDLADLTVMRKKRRDDPYSPGGVAGRRPRHATIIYANRARAAFKGVSLVLGGIEASLRRFAYYDYWTDQVKRSILFDAKADLLVYGMAESALAECVKRLREKRDLHGIRGTAEIAKTIENMEGIEKLSSFEDISAPTPEGRRAFMTTALRIDANQDPFDGLALAQAHGNRWLVAHPPVLPLTTDEIDCIYSLPFIGRPHPAYKGQRIPAFDMIRDSVTTHRGCRGGCRFCAIGSHQGTVIVSRSERSVVSELERLATDRDFHGTVSDLGGPTANMYGISCRLGRARCPDRSCMYPEICRNLIADAEPMLSLLRAAQDVAGINHVFISSGIRFDLAMKDEQKRWLEEVVAHHVGGRMKIAPEHVSKRVLAAMHKPSADVYREFSGRFRQLRGAARKPLELVEYFISGYPGCTLQDMVELALYLRRAKVRPEQVQDFYPAPLTIAAAMFYTGLDPDTLDPIPVARTDREKVLQRGLLLSHMPEFHAKAREALIEAGRADLIGTGPDLLVPTT